MGIRVNKDHPLSTGVTNQIDTTTARTREQGRSTTTSPYLGTTNQNLGTTTTQNIETTTSQNLGTPSQNMRTTRQSAHAEPTTRAPSVKPTRTERTPAVTPKAENEKGPWCKYSCMTNGFCKVKWGGVGKTGGGTCFPLSYKKGECHKNIPSKCTDCHKVMEKRGEPCSKRRSKGPSRYRGPTRYGAKRNGPKRYGE